MISKYDFDNIIKNNINSIDQELLNDHNSMIKYLDSLIGPNWKPGPKIPSSVEIAKKVEKVPFGSSLFRVGPPFNRL
jgi:hypothetical protein